MGWCRWWGECVDLSPCSSPKNGEGCFAPSPLGEGEGGVLVVHVQNSEVFKTSEFWVILLIVRVYGGFGFFGWLLLFFFFLSLVRGGGGASGTVNCELVDFSPIHCDDNLSGELNSKWKGTGV